MNLWVTTIFYQFWKLLSCYFSNSVPISFSFWNCICTLVRCFHCILKVLLVHIFQLFVSLFHFVKFLFRVWKKFFFSVFYSLNFCFIFGSYFCLLLVFLNFKQINLIILALLSKMYPSSDHITHLYVTLDQSHHIECCSSFLSESPGSYFPPF